MNYKLFVFLFAAATFFGAGTLFSATSAHASTVELMSIETLAQILDNPDVVILDVRTGRDWKSSTKKIQGAQRAEPGDFSIWSTKYAKDKKIVLYCA